MSLGAWTNAGGLLDANGELDDMYAALADTCPTVPLDSMQQTYPWFQHAANIHCLSLFDIITTLSGTRQTLEGAARRVDPESKAGRRESDTPKSKGLYVGLSSARG